MESDDRVEHSPRSVLVVEDDVPVRRLIAQHLRQGGFEVAEAGDAAEALVLGERHGRPFDVVLADVYMPGLSGIELARLVLARSPVHPVIVMSGDPDAELARRAIAGGAAAFLRKPFELPELDRTVREAVERLELVEDSEAPGTDGGSRDGDRRAVPVPAAWLRIADERSGAGIGHADRVARIARAVAAALRAPIAAEERRALDLAARSHEAGRLLEPDAAPDDRAVRAAAFLAELGLEAAAAAAVRHLHERWDGTGGPDRLAGPAIPLAARILACADAVDHRAVADGPADEPTEAVDRAIDHVAGEADTAFDPTVVDALENARSAVQAIWMLARLPGLGGAAAYG